SRDAVATLLQIFPYFVLQPRHIASPVTLGHANALTKATDRLWRVAASTEAREGWHAGIIPAANISSLDQGEQLAFAHHRVGEVEAGGTKHCSCAARGGRRVRPRTSPTHE